MNEIFRRGIVAAISALSIGLASSVTINSPLAQTTGKRSATSQDANINVPPPPPTSGKDQTIPTVGNAVASIPADWRQTLGASGDFIQHSKYGEVWKPTVTPPGWHPYPACYWIWTKDQGWYFDDPSSWGKIVHHYGRWTNDQEHGWIWVPGTVYSAGWVTWSTSKTFIGWAPKVPEQDEATTSIDQFNKNGQWIFMDAKKFGKKCGAPCSTIVTPSQPIVVPPPAVVVPPKPPAIIIPFCESNPYHPRCDYRTFCEKYPRHRHCRPKTFCERFPRDPSCRRYCPPGFYWRGRECVRITRVCPKGTVGTWPRCKPIQIRACPKGTAGTWPRCFKPQVTPRRCPPGSLGTYPNCSPVTHVPSTSVRPQGQVRQRPRVSPQGQVRQRPRARPQGQAKPRPRTRPQGQVRRPPPVRKRLD